MGTLIFQGMASDAGDGQMPSRRRTSGGAVKCNQPAVATVTDSIKSYRVCAGHARQWRNTGGSHTVKWDLMAVPEAKPKMQWEYGSFVHLVDDSVSYACSASGELECFATIVSCLLFSTALPEPRWSK